MRRYHIVRRSTEQNDQTLLLTGVLPEYSKSAESLKAAMEAANLTPLSVIKQEGRSHTSQHGKRSSGSHITGLYSNSSMQKKKITTPAPVFYVRIQSGCMEHFIDVIRSQGIALRANRSLEAVNDVEGEERSKIIACPPFIYIPFIRDFHLCLI